MFTNEETDSQSSLELIYLKYEVFQNLCKEKRYLKTLSSTCHCWQISALIFFELVPMFWILLRYRDCFEYATSAYLGRLDACLLASTQFRKYFMEQFHFIGSTHFWGEVHYLSSKHATHTHTQAHSYNKHKHTHTHTHTHIHAHTRTSISCIGVC